ncbi:MAG: hypothetical protein Q7T56_08775 [Nocardioidaceae bacterium]|nr:hypothetical protein [Nocardioidaceae bacterium]
MTQTRFPLAQPVKHPVPALVSHLRDLASSFGQPGISSAERGARAREVADVARDLLDAERAVAGVLPARALPALLNRGLEDAGVRDARRELDEVRAALDFTGLMGTAVAAVPDDPFDGTPLVDLATRVTGHAAGLVVPGLVDVDATGVLNPTLPIPDGETWVVDDVAADSDAWQIAAALVSVSREVIDHTDDRGAALLDSVLLALVDRAAEEYLAGQLVEAATVAAAGANLSTALDTAEGLAGAALNGAADLLVTHPADWPSVRRAVAATWQTDPHPTAAVSCGMPRGTVIVTGRRALTFQTTEPLAISEDKPRMWSRDLAFMRDVLGVVRVPGAVHAVTL